jgi:hypothetical protein
MLLACRLTQVRQRTGRLHMLKCVCAQFAQHGSLQADVWPSPPDSPQFHHQVSLACFVCASLLFARQSTLERTLQLRSQGGCGTPDMISNTCLLNTGRVDTPQLPLKKPLSGNQGYIPYIHTYCTYIPGHKGGGARANLRQCTSARSARHDGRSPASPPAGCAAGG